MQVLFQLKHISIDLRMTIKKENNWLMQTKG